MNGLSAASPLEIYRGYAESDLDLLKQFEAPEIAGRPGFVTSFVGSRVRTSHLPPTLKDIDGQKLGLPVPSDFLSEAIEWVGLLRSVAEAQQRYRMMEIGAGFGPWCTASAVAARRRGIADSRITAVEADPGRFRALTETVADNDCADHATLHEAAAGQSSGIGNWPISFDGPHDAGMRLLPEGGKTDYRGHIFAATREVKIIGLAELLSEHECWDLVHIDVQGHEFDLCAHAIDALTAHVRRIVIGTHSRKLDGDIFDLFWRSGWILENEKPSRVEYRPELPTLEVMTTHDGTQVWHNRALGT